jgi:HK97 family phage portal protein
MTERLMAGRGSVAGPVMSPANALKSPTVWACVQILSGSVAQMPLKVYRELERGGKTVAREHPLYFLLHDSPNPEMTAFSFKETLISHVLTWGNAFAEIEWSDNGQVRALWPLLPDRMGIARNGNGELVYEYYPDLTSLVRLPAWKVLHVPGLGFDGIVGYSPIRLQMDTLGGERAQSEFGWRFFSNGARPGAVLVHPGKLTPEGMTRVKAVWNEAHGGVNNAHRVAVLQEGMSLHTIGIPPNEAQFLESRQFTKREIAAFYRVPPQMLGDMEHATYASAEQFSHDFVVFSLGEILKRFEEAIAHKLLLGEEKRQYKPEFVRAALVITQIAERYQAHATGIQSGFKTPNEAREQENLNPLPGGDDLLLPLNLRPATEPIEPSATPALAAPNDEEDRRASVVEMLVRDAQRRLTARVLNDIRQGGAKALRRGGCEALAEWTLAEMSGWRVAGDELLELARQAGQALDRRVDAAVGRWVEDALTQGIGELTNG